MQQFTVLLITISVLIGCSTNIRDGVGTSEVRSINRVDGPVPVFTIQASEPTLGTPYRIKGRICNTTDLEWELAIDLNLDDLPKIYPVLVHISYERLVSDSWVDITPLSDGLGRPYNLQPTQEVMFSIPLPHTVKPGYIIRLRYSGLVSNALTIAL